VLQDFSVVQYYLQYVKCFFVCLFIACLVFFPLDLAELAFDSRRGYKVRGNTCSGYSFEAARRASAILYQGVV